MTLATLVSPVAAHHGQARADSVLALLSAGCVLEFLRVAEEPQRATCWIRTVNQRPVPAATPQELAALAETKGRPDFRLFQLSRAQRQLDDLLASPEFAGQPDPLLTVCEAVRAAALAEFAEGSVLSASAWLPLGARFAQHAMRLEPEVAVAVWQALPPVQQGQVDLDGLQLPQAVRSGIAGCIRAQEQALQGRQQALERLRAAARALRPA